MATTNRTIPTYQDGFTIEYHSSDDLYHCLNNGEAMSKKEGKPAAYKSLALAKKFMQSQGAQEVVKEPEQKGYKLWTPPPAAVMPSLEEQLAALPDDAPRFVVVQAPYGSYKEQGWTCYDREEEEFAFHSKGPSQSWNGVWNQQDFAEQHCTLCNAEPPVKYRYDKSFARALAKGNAEDAGQSVADIFFDEDTQNDYFGPNRHPQMETKPESEKECTFVGRDQHQVGDIITDRDGNRYRVIEPSYYISERESAEMEDANDASVEVGWHTKSVLVEVESELSLQQQPDSTA